LHSPLKSLYGYGRAVLSKELARLNELKLTPKTIDRLLATSIEVNILGPAKEILSSLKRSVEQVGTITPELQIAINHLDSFVRLHQPKIQSKSGQKNPDISKHLVKQSPLLFTNPAAAAQIKAKTQLGSQLENPSITEQLDALAQQTPSAADA